MKLKTQFLVLVGITIIGMLIVFVVGITRFTNLSGRIDSLNSLHNDYETILEADRDAYQAFMAEDKAMEETEIKSLQQRQKDYKENREQTRERIPGPGENFTSEMQSQFSHFKEHFKLMYSEYEAVSILLLYIKEFSGGRHGYFSECQSRIKNANTHYFYYHPSCNTRICLFSDSRHYRRSAKEE
jgi:hypothetical protein